MTLRSIASNFGTDGITARLDAERLSAALDQAVVLWFESGSWFCTSVAKAFGYKLDFPHEIIKSK